MGEQRKSEEHNGVGRRVREGILKGGGKRSKMTKGS